MYYNTLTKHTV